MSKEETQKQIDFIVEHQARFSVNQEKADERLTRLEKIVANAYVDMRDRYNALVDAQLRTEEKMAESGHRLNALVDAQLRNESTLVSQSKETNARFNTLADSQLKIESMMSAQSKETDARFKALADSQLKTESIMSAQSKGTDARFKALAEAQLKSEAKIAAVAEAQLQLSKTQEHLTESQKHTDNRLSSLINIVDRHITGHDNGGRG